MNNNYIDPLADITADEAKEIFEDFCDDYWIDQYKNDLI